MKVLHGLEALEPPLARSVLTIGNFDGVHRAHQQLLAQAGLLAANTGDPLVVLTFEPHPLSVVAPERAPGALALPDEKLRFLAGAGADIVVIAKSEPTLLGLEAERFIEEVVVRQFHPKHIVEGPSFGFGRGRKGTPELLQQIAARFACKVHIVDPVTLRIDEDETLLVSSSLIRRLLSEGKVRRAAACLGRDYSLGGEVVAGDGRGRTLGFPTANIAAAQQIVPADGVYAGRTMFQGDTFLSAISIGNTPTFHGTGQRIEAHLLDFEGRLYGEPVRIEFERRLRDQRAFDSPEALVRQLHCDVEVVRGIADDSKPDPQGGKEKVP